MKHSERVLWDTERYKHICDCLNHIVKSDLRNNEVAISNSHDDDIVMLGNALDIGNLILSTLSDLGRPSVFKSGRSVCHFLSYQSEKDYVVNRYNTGRGWSISKPIVGPYKTKYIFKHKRNDAT